MPMFSQPGAATARTGRTVTALTGAAAVGAVLGAGVLMTVTSRMARLIVTPDSTAVEDVEVLAVDEAAGTITLTATADSALEGRYSFWFNQEAGDAQVGSVLQRRAGAVTRRLERLRYGQLVAGARGRMASWYYREPEELGLPVRSVGIPVDRGQAPAWLFEAPGSDHWMIGVHGRGTRRQEGLRAVPVFHECGYTVLLTSYRNDGDAPQSADRRYALGGTEWADVEAALEFAVAHGARSVVLMGWSMGGAIVLQTVTRTRHHDVLAGVVLDSPVIDWVDTLHFQAALRRLPDVVTAGALRMIGAPWGKVFTGQDQPISLAEMDFVTRAADLTLPTLILHSDDDGFVPAAGSRALARARPDLVTLVPFTDARHTKLWNYDPERWSRAIRDWLTGIAE